MLDLSSDSAAQDYKQGSFSAQKVDDVKSINTDVFPQVREAILQSRLWYRRAVSTAYLAEKVGPEGRVFGVDPDKERVQLARQTLSDIKNLFF